MQRFAIALALLGFLCAGSMTAAEGAKPAVQSIDLGDFDGGMAKGAWDKPTVITSADELAKAIADKKVQAKVGKEVNFKEQKLLYFAWSGSGTDQLSPASVEVRGTTVVTFTYVPGMTDDVRQHFKLFAVPAKAEVKFAK